MVNLKKRQPNFLNLIPDKQLQRKFLLKFREILRDGNFILGPEVKNFEKEFANFLGTKYCIGVGNGLEALQISLMCLGIKEGDEIITTPISAAATTLAILLIGAKPVFVDTTSDGLINTDLIPEAITKKTKAIIPVHLYGHAVNLESLKLICRKNNLFLIEDAAQGAGSKYQGKHLGTFGDINCFSFYPTKNLGALGDGGAIVTNSKRLAKICYQIRDYGQDGKYNHIRLGLNSRLDEIQAGFLSVKLKYLVRDNQKRRNLAKRYIKKLADIPSIQIIIPRKNNISNFHLFVIRTSKRNSLQKFLATQNIPTLVHYPKILPHQPFLKEFRKINLPIAEKFTKTCLSLPLHPKMDFNDIDYISLKIIEFFKK